MAEAILQLQDVNSGYHGQTVLHGLTLDVPEGSLVTIIGPNGHGKTTLLRTVSGLVKPTNGDILFEGRSILGRRADQIVRLGVVHIPQGDMIFSEMTVKDNLLMGAYLPDASRRATQSLDEVYEFLPRLAEREKQISSSLSGGERRMLAIGRGLMSGGRILLVDEPSLGLAPIIIEQIYGLIARLKETGRTILLVEENAARIEDLADQVFLLDNGHFVWQGAPQELALNEDVLETYLGG
jgi:branched-chain amino acid transport system ATP-binding protein